MELSPYSILSFLQKQHEGGHVYSHFVWYIHSLYTLYMYCIKILKHTHHEFWCNLRYHTICNVLQVSCVWKMSFATIMVVLHNLVTISSCTFQYILTILNLYQELWHFSTSQNVAKYCNKKWISRTEPTIF